jgi:hypothetical protein
MASHIPDEWKTRVCDILRARDRSKITVRDVVWKDWESTFPNAWPDDLYNALEDALNAPRILGARKFMDEAGETYAFLFEFEEAPLFGKINLLPDGRVIIVYSAHRRRKGDTL